MAVINIALAEHPRCVHAVCVSSVCSVWVVSARSVCRVCTHAVCESSVQDVYFMCVSCVFAVCVRSVYPNVVCVRIVYFVCM